MRFLATLLFLGILPLFLAAQSAEGLSGAFNREQVKIGEEVEYLLVYRHAADVEFRFPDDRYDFTPFELLEARPSPTVTVEGESVDSIRYTLATYELGSPQQLSVPVIVLGADGQEVRLFPETDQVLLEEVVKNMPDSLKLFESTTPMVVTRTFNFYYWLFGLVVLLILVVAMMAIFGKRIRKFLAARRLTIQHQKFLNAYQSQISAANNDRLNIMGLLLLWKEYVGKLTGYPLPSLTTKEIAESLHVEALNVALKKVDRAIYGGKEMTDIEQDFGQLIEAATLIYNEKLKEVQHG